MNKWFKLFLATALIAALVAGGGGVRPALAAPGDILYRVNAGGPLVAISGALNWGEDRVRDSVPYSTGQWNCAETQVGTSSNLTGGDTMANDSGCFTGVAGTIGDAPAELFRTYRYASEGRTLSYAFRVEGGKRYTVDLYFAEPFADHGREFSVVAEGRIPAEFANITFSAAGVPIMRSTTVKVHPDDQWLNLTWQRINGEPMVSGIQITELPPDEEPPVVSITSHEDDDVAAGTVTIMAAAADNDEVTQVEFFVGGAPIGVDDDGSDGWSADWDTTAFDDDWYELTARATDASGNTGESGGVWVLVDNIATALEFIRPANGATVSGQVEIALTGSPDLMWVEVWFDDLDGEFLGETELIDGVWVLAWDTTLVEDGEYVLLGYGMTETEEGIESQVVQVTVQNTEDPPDDDDPPGDDDPPADEPTPTVPDVLPAMLCDLDDGSLNALHCGRPVAIFRHGADLHLYGIDINTGHGSLALVLTAAEVEAVGVPADVPVLLAAGENPYTFRPMALYRLPSGEIQLNTAYWDGKEYIVKWQPGAAHVDVIHW